MPHAGEDEKAHAHPCTAKNQGDSPTETLNEVEAGEGTHDVDGPQDYLGLETVVEASGNEDSRAIVEKKISASQLLECLQYNSKDGAVGHAWASEDFPPMRLTACGFCFQGLLHFRELKSHLPVVVAHAEQFCHGIFGKVGLALAKVVLGRFREE